MKEYNHNIPKSEIRDLVSENNPIEREIGRKRRLIDEKKPVLKREEVQFQNNYYYNFNNNYGCTAVATGEKPKDECSRQSRASRTVEV